MHLQLIDIDIVVVSYVVAFLTVDRTVLIQRLWCSYVVSVVSL
jgi:hypothetical protein